MGNVDLEKLLSDKRVIEEINRHLWIESEKAGHDIGFDQAREDWLKRFSKTWMEYHMPEAFSKSAPQKSFEKESKISKAAAQDQSAIKRRRAKSYM